MATWLRSTSMHACQSLDCEVTVPRDEPLCAIGAGGHIKICASCAKRRFKYDVPADLPHLRPPMPQQIAPVQQALAKMSDAVEPAFMKEGAMERFNRAFVANKTREAIKSNLKLVRSANANDPSLKRLGKDA